jgi:hypothetical protein
MHMPVKSFLPQMLLDISAASAAAAFKNQLVARKFRPAS